MKTVVSIPTIGSEMWAEVVRSQIIQAHLVAGTSAPTADVIAAIVVDAVSNALHALMTTCERAPTVDGQRSAVVSALQIASAAFLDAAKTTQRLQEEHGKA